MTVINKNESGIIKVGPGIVKGININSHTNGTIALIDGTEGSAVAVGTLTSVGAMAAASHATSKIVSSGALVPGSHAVTVFTNAGTNHKDVVKASGTLTSDDTDVSDGDTATFGTQVYTFKTDPVAANQVLVGGTAVLSMLNLYKAAKFGSGPSGTISAEVNEGITLSLSDSGLVITATAKLGGTAGNSIACDESSAHLTWDGDKNALTGGLAAETVTIGTKVYTFRDSLSVNPPVANEVLIGATVEASLVNLKDAIIANETSGLAGTTFGFGTVAHTQVTVSAFDATTITLKGRVAGTSLNTVATTETCAAASFPDTTLGGGTGASDAGVTVAGATVTIGSTVYTFVTELSESLGADAVAYQVLYGGDEATALDNLKAAINASGVVGTNYSTGTLAHPGVVATTNTDTEQTVIARTPGVTPNAYATTTTCANTAWEDTTLGGGTGASDAGVTTAAATITINGRVYTFVTALSETSGASAIADQILHGAAVANALDNMKLAINGGSGMGSLYSTGTIPHGDVIATTNAADSQVIQARLLGSAGNAITTTETLANTTWGAATLASGSGAVGSLILNTNTLSAVATTGERFIDLFDTSFTRGLYITVGGVLDCSVILE
jgi:hypothetical protein